MGSPGVCSIRSKWEEYYHFVRMERTNSGAQNLAPPIHPSASTKLSHRHTTWSGADIALGFRCGGLQVCSESRIRNRVGRDAAAIRFRGPRDSIGRFLGRRVRQRARPYSAGLKIGSLTEGQDFRYVGSEGARDVHAESVGGGAPEDDLGLGEDSAGAHVDRE